MNILYRARKGLTRITLNLPAVVMRSYMKRGDYAFQDRVPFLKPVAVRTSYI